MKPDVDRQAWWYAAWRWAGGDRARLKAIRDVSASLSERALWPLIRVELRTVSTGMKGILPPRIALAALLDTAWRLAPSGYSALLDALAVATLGRLELASVASLARAFDPIIESFVRHMSAHAGDAPSLVEVDVSAWDILPPEASTSTSSEMLHRQATVILAYRDKSPDLGIVRAGIGAAAAWASDPLRRSRLAGVQNLPAASIFADLVTLLGLACLRMRRHLGGLGMSLGAPDPAVMDTPAPALGALVVALDGIARASAAAHAALLAPAPERVPEPVVVMASILPVAVVAPSPELDPGASRHDALREALIRWTAGDHKKLDALFDHVDHLPKNRLWHSLRPAVQRMPIAATARVQELARFALASFLDEFRLAFPRKLSDLLELVTVEAHETIRHDETGRLWKLCEPFFEGWASRLVPEFLPKDCGKVLHNHGDILPWMDNNRARARRDKDANKAIDDVYVDDNKDPETVRLAVYCAATRARNDFAHEVPSSLRGRVSPVMLLNDTVALLCLASVRFKLRLAEVEKTQPTLPDVRAFSLAPP